MRRRIRRSKGKIYLDCFLKEEGKVVPLHIFPVAATQYQLQINCMTLKGPLFFLWIINPYLIKIINNPSIPSNCLLTTLLFFFNLKQSLFNSDNFCDTLVSACCRCFRRPAER